MRARPKNSKMAECLDGIDELRAAVRWANNQREDSHDWCTAEQVLRRYRDAKSRDLA